MRIHPNTPPFLSPRSKGNLRWRKGRIYNFFTLFFKRKLVLFNPEIPFLTIMRKNKKYVYVGIDGGGGVGGGCRNEEGFFDQVSF